ncbi:MAG: type II secretion system F family protein, partial [Thermodesulfobacteriota bacterium]|nr:type II secretion system F family protein [Thermodesulfobacteriota bacterium]
MSFFRFKVIEPTGKILTGIIKLPYDNPSSVITYLEQDNNVAISVKKLNFFSTLFMDCATASIGTKVSRPLVAEFLSNLSLMIKGGITLMASLQESAGETSNPAFREIIEDMVQGMGGGRTFSDMVEKHKNIFPKTVIHLIRIGEETGKLDQMLRDASEHLKRIHTIIDDTKQALLYPAFVFLTMGAAFFFWFYYVVPKILTLFKEMNVELPTLTVLLLKVSAFVQYNFWSLIGILILTPFILITGYKNSSFLRKVFDVIFLKLPVVGNII